MEFDEFLKMSKINSENIESLKENIKEHIKDKSNFKDIIDLAFWGIISLAVFNPIIDYLSSIYFPTSSSELDANAIMIYLFSVSLLIFIALFINYMIHKINDTKNKNEKRLYISLLEKLNNYNYDINDSERYNE